ncbi:MAG: hypothetical protein SGILL_009630, partial [Bacillariaceae sp.]
MVVLRSACKLLTDATDVEAASSLLDLAVDLSGPVAAAKNRASRNLSIAQSKVEMKTSLSPKKPTSPKAKEAKTVVVEQRVTPTKRASKKPVPPSPVNFDTRLTHSKFYTFPFRLYDILEEAEQDGNEHIISFNENGDQVVIRDRQQFAEKILPKWFGHSNIRSFDRQCSYWGFKRVLLVVPSKTITWSHPCLLRGQRDLVQELQRVEGKQQVPLSIQAKRKIEKLCAKVKKEKAKAKKNDQKRAKSDVVKASPNKAEEQSKQDAKCEAFSEDVCDALDSMRTVSPTTGSVLQIVPAPSPRMETATRRVSDSSLTVLNSSKPAKFSLPFVPEDALDADGFDDDDLFPEIDVEAVMPSVVEDPLEVNPFHLIDEDQMSEDDDEVSVLSMSDIDGPLDGFYDDVEDLISCTVENDKHIPHPLDDYHYADEVTARTSYLCEDPVPDHYTAFAQSTIRASGARDLLLPPPGDKLSLPKEQHTSLILVPGALVKPEQYGDVARAIQQESEQAVWVSVPFIQPVANPIMIGTAVKDAMARLKRFGFPGTKAFVGGHSLGGAFLPEMFDQNQVSVGEVEGLIHLGCILSRKAEENPNVNQLPHFVLTGELDGLVRASRVAVDYHRYVVQKQNDDNTKDAMLNHAVVLVPGMNHFGFVSGEPPFMDEFRDLQGELS